MRGALTGKSCRASVAHRYRWNGKNGIEISDGSSRGFFGRQRHIDDDACQSIRATTIKRIASLHPGSEYPEERAATLIRPGFQPGTVGSE
jgi:hypothetical protein